jgi:membrane protease YdiL (CAAX protease family)
LSDRFAAPEARTGAPPPGERDAGGLVLLATYVTLWVPAIVLLAVWSLVLILGDAAIAHGTDGLTEAVRKMGLDAAAGLPTWVLAGTLALQLPVMFALAPAAHWIAGWLWYRPRDPSRARPEGWRGVFGARRAPVGFYVLGALTGLVIGVFPGWIAERLQDLLPSLGEGMIQQIDTALRSGSPLARAVFVLEIAVGAPLVEELVFRGFMWDALRRVLPVPAVWVATSLIFAGYHMDPVQSVALVFTALGLGWLRWMSGSVWPGVLLHAVNNGLGVISAIALGGNADQHVSTAVAWSTAAASVLLLGVVARVRVGRGGALASDAPLA